MGDGRSESILPDREDDHQANPPAKKLGSRRPRQRKPSDG